MAKRCPDYWEYARNGYIQVSHVVFYLAVFPDLKVKFAFTNRTTSVCLGDEIDVDELRVQIAHVQTLQFTDGDIAYLRTWGMFPKKFLTAMRGMKLPDVCVEKTSDGQLRIEVEGLWFHTTFWELFILPIISELRMRAFVGEDIGKHKRVIKDLESCLMAKIPDIRTLQWMISLFGLRRRATGDWERRFTDILLNEIPVQIVGVSNVAIAREYGVEATGTNAHEVPMALAALRRHEGKEAVIASQYEVLEKWQQLYGHKALVMLGDTFGSTQFFHGLPRQFALDFTGPRQDSGDAILFGEEMIAMYERCGIDPLSKRVIFSDGLTVPKMQELERRFVGRIGGGFGWGTNGTFDTQYLQPISIVMKLVEAAGNPAVKLSDNVAKAIGVESEVAIYKDFFGYNTTFNEQAVY